MLSRGAEELGTQATHYLVASHTDDKLFLFFLKACKKFPPFMSLPVPVKGPITTGIMDSVPACVHAC